MDALEDNKHEYFTIFTSIQAIKVSLIETRLKMEIKDYQQANKYEQVYLN